MTTILADTPIQVRDTAGRWHAAAVGPGVLCQATTAQEETPAVQTVAWEFGTDRVNCPRCAPLSWAAVGVVVPDDSLEDHLRATVGLPPMVRA